MGGDRVVKDKVLPKPDYKYNRNAKIWILLFRKCFLVQHRDGGGRTDDPRRWKGHQINSINIIRMLKNLCKINGYVNGIFLKIKN